MPDYNLIAAEFALGRVLAVTPLAGGAPDVAKLTATYGAFVVKPGHDRTSAELYARVASVLNTAGIRQAVHRQTLTGSAISASGYTVQEFLPGRICLDPAAAQIAATMRHIAEYHEALKKLPPPAALRVADSIWKRAASSEHLLGELPGLLRDPQIWSGPDRPPELLPVVETALGLLRGSLPLMNRLPRQLVHGDIGPDNVLMNGDRVVAIIDFTPHDEPFLFALCSAVYWYHVYGRDHLDLDAVRASLAAGGAGRPWTELEAAAWPVLLIREALRRLATALAVAGQAGTPAEATAVGARYRALRSVLRARPGLSALVSRLPAASSHSKRTNSGVE